MKMNKNDLTQGKIERTLIRFALPYLLACFMQTFYGMADLFVVGLYHGADTTTAVSIGSQIMHMLTVIIVGASMGTTVTLGRMVGAKDQEGQKRTIGTTVITFALLTVVITGVLLLLTGAIVQIMLTPEAAVTQTKSYLYICFAGVPFIMAYNVISSIFRGMGDSKSPMYFVAVACIANVFLDFLFIGYFQLGAVGAALGTICGQASGCLMAGILLKNKELGFRIKRGDIRATKAELVAIVKVGLPIAMQDGFIQVAFIIITIIANSRGLIAAAGVGIVEKLISFMFLVPSAFLSAISAVSAQNIGAGKPERARRALYCGLTITMIFGALCFLYNQFLPQTLVGLFTKDSAVLAAGCDYMRSYSLDCFFAAIHFCFSGYFCGNQQSGISFLHNIIAIICVRIPFAYGASVLFPDSLYPMGMAAPIGSLLSALICIGFYIHTMGSGTLAMTNRTQSHTKK